MLDTECRICSNANENQLYLAKEMMFGFLDEFTYFECSKCGCLQICEVPINISKYYPPEYYSFQPFRSSSNSLRSRMNKFVIVRINRFALFGKGAFGRLAYQRYPAEFLRLISKAGLTEDSRILDVGCGSGSMLYTLKEAGFKNCLGIDKYISEDIQYKNGLKIQKSVIQDVDGKWDLIIFNHSLEHMFDQLQTLQAASKLLAETGVCLINLPIVSSYAWKKYRTNWFHLDAPRHFFLHSTKTLEILAEKVNLF